MRKSLEDIAHMVVEREYIGELPEELRPYHAYLKDAGHSIMCVLTTHKEEAATHGIEGYEIPVPVKYVLEKGYKNHGDHIEVDAEYNYNFGLDVDDKYTEY